MSPGELQPPTWPVTEKQTRIREQLDQIRTESRPATTDLPQQVAQVLDYIHDHLFDPGLNAEAVRVGCSIGNHNISTRFRRTVGVGIRAHIEARRLEAAAALLLRDRRIESSLVGLGVGYGHEETFSRAFRRRFECPPSVYRRRGSPCQTPAT